MGINLEGVQLLIDQINTGNLKPKSVIEFGAQDLTPMRRTLPRVFRKNGFKYPEEPVETAQGLYKALGFQDYKCIDAIDLHGALNFDLNLDLNATYGFDDQFDLVTNFGTTEHCFNQYACFKSIHDTCLEGGMMLHSVPISGYPNHGFFAYQPRFFADLAAANGYELISIGMTVDCKPRLVTYTKKSFKKYGSRDLHVYTVMRKMNSNEFVTPFDGVYQQQNQLSGYSGINTDHEGTLFDQYLRTGDWRNILVDDPLDRRIRRIIRRFKSYVANI
ncbi:MAG: hypothetical protein HON65_09535 [Rhodospirillales bacterium]|nr:hypothetical protein [Rhodospirillales bacterium]